VQEKRSSPRSLGVFGDDEIGDRTDQSKVSCKGGTHRYDLPSPAGGLVTLAAGLPSLTYSRTIRDDQNQL
jgi:hypothetical protein